jgi:hypothetical protein
VTAKPLRDRGLALAGRPRVRRPRLVLAATILASSFTTSTVRSHSRLAGVSCFCSMIVARAGRSQRRSAVPAPRRPEDEEEAEREDSELDEALEETFPASDPIAPAIPSHDR